MVFLSPINSLEFISGEGDRNLQGFGDQSVFFSKFRISEYIHLQIGFSCGRR